jgi:hypothetical protein
MFLLVVLIGDDLLLFCITWCEALNNAETIISVKDDSCIGTSVDGGKCVFSIVTLIPLIFLTLIFFC